MHNATHSIAALLGTSLIALSAQAGQTTNFRLLIDERVPYDDVIYVSAISADGTTVVGAMSETGTHHLPFTGFKWTPETGVFEELVQKAHIITDVSGDGSAVAGTRHAEVENPGQFARAMLWKATGDQFIGDVQTWAYGISDDGTRVVGYAWTGPNYEACWWDNGVRTIVPHTLSHRSSAHGVSGDGKAIFGSFVRPNEQASHGSFLHYVGGEAFELEAPLLDPRLDRTIRTRVLEVNGDGTVAVGSAFFEFDLIGSDGVVRPNRQVELAWVWRQGQGYELLGSFNNDNRISFDRTNFKSAFAISDDASVIIGNGEAFDPLNRNDIVPMIWTPTEGPRKLEELLTDAYSVDLTGWSLSATSISGDGTVIAGIATRDADGVRSPFAVDIPAVINVCSADMNDDFAVDLGDFGAFGAAFGSALGDLNYNERADFDGDGDVDLGDFGQFGEQFGRSGTDCAE